MITKINSHPITILQYLSPLPRARGQGVDYAPVYTGGLVNKLFAPLQALVILSDLQGRTDSGQLYGVAGAQELSAICQNIGLKPKESIGVLLGGDFFTSDKRGGTGDVREVWEAFSTQFRWVTGVPGNHDYFGSKQEFRCFSKIENLALLDNEIILLDGLNIAGLGGIIGNPRKPYRRSEEDYLQCLRILTHRNPDVLIIHEAPEMDAYNYPGSKCIANALKSLPQTTVVCGHKNWRQGTLGILANGTQILNCNSKVFILKKEENDG